MKKNKKGFVPALISFGAVIALSCVSSRIILNTKLKDLTLGVAVLSAVTNNPSVLCEIEPKSLFSLSPEKSETTNIENTISSPLPNTKKVPREIPEEFKGEVIEEVFSPVAVSGKSPAHFKNAVINNLTEISSPDIESILKKPWQGKIEGDFSDDKPLVLIYHTHATESFEPTDSLYYDKRETWRSRVNSENITSVGDEICKELKKAGIPYIHDKTQHDYPSYNASYKRSEETVSNYLEKYPSIKIAIDVHRDAVQRGETLVKPVTTIDGKKTAQLMIAIGCDGANNSVPTWEENLRLASLLQDKLSSDYPGLARPLLLLYRKYNQHLLTGAMLVEIGSHGNTLEEAKSSATYFGKCLSDLILELKS